MIEWGDRSRPVGRWVPRAILRRFDRVADWLDVAVGRVHGVWIERWDVLEVIVAIPVISLYAIWLDDWRGLIFGVFMWALGSMAFRWFV